MNKKSWPDAPPATDDEFTDAALNLVWCERVRQDQKWGSARHLNSGTGPGRTGVRCDRAIMAKHTRESSLAEGRGTWRHVLDAEIAAAFAEDSPERLKALLIQVAAVAVAWIEDLERGQK